MIAPTVAFRPGTVVTSPLAVVALMYHSVPAAIVFQ
jgi:hypothetical protein